MAKETKQDRVVRQMMIQMTEHVAELRAFEANPTKCKETDVEKWALTFLKSCLGYTVSNDYIIKAQDQKGKLRPDLVVYHKEKPIFVIEVKKLGFDFEKSDFRNGKVQLREYLATFEDVPYGFLCNGHEWRLYDFTNKENAIEIQKVSFKPDGATIDTSKRQIEDMCYEFSCFHETSYNSTMWAELSKEATAFSPDSLAKAILSLNVMKVITREIRGEHEYKASTDLLYEKVFHLLSEGLDDTLRDSYTPDKKAEFAKFIKIQMKQARKIKKPTKLQAEDLSSSIAQEMPSIELKNEDEAA